MRRRAAASPRPTPKGVILPPPLSESVPILSELALSKTPVVTVAMGQLYPNALNVRIDDFAAAKEMTEYLLGLGHRRIGLITGHPEHIASARTGARVSSRRSRRRACARRTCRSSRASSPFARASMRPSSC